MRVTRPFHALNWKYAIGELTLIVVGITIALAANTWYQERQERTEELLLMQQLHQALTSDLEQLAATVETIRQDEIEIDVLVSRLESGDPYSDTLRSSFRALSRFRSSSIQSAPFETLKARGLGLITGESLRFDLMSLYEDAAPDLASTNRTNQNFSEQMVMPYLMENFRQVSPEEGYGWVPLDYDQIRADSRMLNLARQRLVSIRLFQLPTYERTIMLMEDILHELEVELVR